MPATRARPRIRLPPPRPPQDLQAEREEITKLDTTEVGAGERWYIVESSWLRHWREYCWDRTRTDPPGPISNSRLLAGKQPRPNLMRARDYRGVNYDVWRVFVHRYCGGPAICRCALIARRRRRPRFPPETPALQIAPNCPSAALPYLPPSACVVRMSACIPPLGPCNATLGVAADASSAAPQT